MHGSALHYQLARCRQFIFELFDKCQRGAHRETVGVDMDLQRTDSRREVNDSWYCGFADMVRERLHPHAKSEIKCHRSVLDTHVVIDLAAVCHSRTQAVTV